MSIIIVVERHGYSIRHIFHPVGTNVSMIEVESTTSITIHVRLVGHRRQLFIYRMLPNGKHNTIEVIQCSISSNIDFYRILRRMNNRCPTVGNECSTIKVDRILSIIFRKQLNGKIQDKWIITYSILHCRMVLKCS